MFKSKISFIYVMVLSFFAGWGMMDAIETFINHHH
jgi:hypothetical protein